MKTKIIGIIIALVAVLTILTACGEVRDRKIEGKFCSVQEAYDNGLISKNDIKQFAKLHNNVKDEALLNNTKNRGIEKVLPEDLEKEIKTAYIAKITKSAETITEEAYEKTIIVEYLGEYSGCYALILNNLDVVEDCSSAPRTESVAGVDIIYQPHNEEILIYY